MTEINDYDENTEDSAVDDEEAKAAESGADSEEETIDDADPLVPHPPLLCPSHSLCKSKRKQ